MRYIQLIEIHPFFEERYLHLEGVAELDEALSCKTLRRGTALAIANLISQWLEVRQPDIVGRARSIEVRSGRKSREQYI